MQPKQQEEINRLCKQSKLLNNGSLLPEVVAVLKDGLPSLPIDIFLLWEIPEQGEDLYVFALDADNVCTVEIPRSKERGFIESIESFRDFRRRPHSSGTNRILDAIEFIVQR